MSQAPFYTKNRHFGLPLSMALATRRTEPLFKNLMVGAKVEVAK